MSAQIGFIGGLYFHVQDSYDDVIRRFGPEPFEVTLSDGMYGTLGTTMRLFVNPAGIAYVQDLDGREAGT